ncbi:beta strand repeat-containing protein [Polynucleobacter necessarius]|uniref:beta strand repeat-containing protein n=1 Tax=Polynucleobacter necessarius TaxID=576610 RepID=UPI000E095F29|nr:MBG domain-containing protein [Polynucleobacter necessarius]
MTASNQNTIYGTPLDLGTASFTATGLLSGDSISSVTLTQLGNTTVPGTQNAGTYSGSVNGILASVAVGSGLSNYQITFVPGTLTIAKKGINVIADNASMTYADANLPTLSYQSVSGLVNGDQMSGALATTATPYSGVAGSASNVGSYFITQGTVTADSNYEITFTRASLTVNPASLYVTAENQSSTYGSLLVLPQSGSDAYSVVGLRNGDFISSSTVLYSGNQTVPGTTNAGSYVGLLDISAATGVGMSNYNISYVAGDLSIAKAELLVTAVDDGKFVGMSDPSGYAGVMYSGFKNSDTDISGALGSAVVSVSRSNSSVNDAGTYSGVLVPNVDRVLDNYTVSYGNGNFTIAGANELLVLVGNNTTVYGAAPTYSAGSMTVSYCTDCAAGNNSPNIVSITGADVSVSGSTVTVTAGSTTGVFSLTPTNPVMNSSNTQLKVGGCSLGASGTDIATTGGSPNFNAVTAIGGLTVTPLVLTYADLGVTGITQEYSGSVNMSNLELSTASGFLPGDSVTASATGTFATKNVGSNIAYTIGVALAGSDSANYEMSAGASYTENNGVITQLASVTYTGSSAGGNWSNPANWTTTGTPIVGAIPDLSNVATVIIPLGSNVIYDAGVDGPVTSSISNSGNITISLPSATTISTSISGAGFVTIANSATITLDGDSSYTGGTIISAGAHLIAGSNNAIGTGSIMSNGTAINPASFATSSGIVLPAMNIAGGPIEIWSDITTAGAQTYDAGLLIGPSGSGLTTLTSSNANITFNSTLDGATDKSESLAINAGTGNVTFVDGVGSIARLNNLTVTGAQIYILADILTAVTQTYNGSIFIGDASYVGLTPTIGFLFTDQYRAYFEYSATTDVRASSIDCLNTNPIYVRTMISEDPSVTYNGSVNDTVDNTHTLLVAAIAPAIIPESSGLAAINAGASISFNDAVGFNNPLYSLNSQVVVNQSQVNADTAYIGTINSVDGVRTYSDQTYRANLMSAQSETQPGGVAFSVWDPDASVNFNLPVQTASNSAYPMNCGQLNLQNPNSRDVPTIDGSNNFGLDPNLSGVNNWGDEFVQNRALGYVPPVVPPAIAPPIQASLVRASYVPIVNGGMLREVLDFHADQVQMAVDARIFGGGVTVSEPGAINEAPKTTVFSSVRKGSKAKLDLAGTVTICSVDEKGEESCGEE